MPKKQQRLLEFTNTSQLVNHIILKETKTHEFCGNDSISILLQHILKLLSEDVITLAELLRKIKQLNSAFRQNSDVSDGHLKCLCDIFIALKHSCTAKSALKSCFQRLNLLHSAEILSCRFLQHINKYDETICCSLVESIQSCFENFNVGKTAIELILPDILNFLQHAISVYINMKRQCTDSDLKFINFLIKCICSVVQSCRTNSTNEIDCFVEMRKSCLVVLSNDDFVGDCCQTAGLLNALLIITIKSSERELIDSINNALNFDGEDNICIKSEYSKLSLLNGFMSMVETSTLTRLSTGMEDNLLCCRIFNELKTIQDTVKDSLTAVMCARTIVQFSLLLCKSDLQSERSISIANFLLRYAMVNIDHSQDSIHRQARYILQNSVKFLLNQTEVSVSELLQAISFEDWHKRSTFYLFSAILDHSELEQLTKHIPNLKIKLLNVMSDQSLVPYACDVYKKLANKSLKEGLDECMSENLNPVLHKIADVDQSHASLIVEYLLSHLLKLYSKHDGIVKYFIQYYNEQIPSTAHDDSDSCGSFVALMMCLRITNHIGFSVKLHDNDALSYRTMQQALIHHDDKVRLMALSMLCESAKTTSYVSEQQMNLIKFALPFNCNNQNSAFRHQFIDCIKKVVVRIYLNAWDLVRRSFENFDLQKSFCSFLLSFCTSNLHQDSPYCKRITLLSILQNLFDTTVRMFPDLNNQHLFGDAKYLSDETTLVLCVLLKDDYDDVAQIAYQLLLSEKDWHFGIDIVNSHLSVSHSMDLARKCHKPEHCKHAAYQLKLMTILSKPTCETETTNCMRHISAILCTLSEDILVAKTSLYNAAMNCPLYGSLHCVRSLFNNLITSQDFLVDFSAEQNVVLREIVGKIISWCFEISKLVLPVVSSVSPEGHLPETTNSCDELSDEMKRLFLLEANTNESSNRVIAQHLLVCCWRSAKETSLLLQEVTSQSVALDSSPAVEDGMISWNLLLLVGEHLKSQLLESRHRGAFELAFAAFKTFVPRLWNSPHAALYKVPHDWLLNMLEVIQDPIKSRSLCATRRSAGLPFFIQALLSDKSKRCKEHLPIVMEQLIRCCNDENQQNQTVKIHSLNILRALVRDATLTSDMSPYLSKCTQIAINGFSSSIWDVRNTSTLLFAALFNKIFGVKRDKDVETSRKNRISSYRFFTILPGIREFLLERLSFVCEQMEKGFTIQPLLHPILLMFSNIHSSTLNPTSLKSFVQLFVRCGRTSVYKSRVAAANALSSVLSHDQIAPMLMLLCQRINNDAGLSQNHCHAILLQINRILETRILQDNHTATVKDVFKPLMQILIRTESTKLKYDKCAITNNEFLKVYLNTIKLSQAYGKKVKRLDDLSTTILEDSHICTQDDASKRVIGHSMLQQTNADILFHQDILCPSTKKIKVDDLIAMFRRKPQMGGKYELLNTLEWNAVQHAEHQKLHEFLTSELLNKNNDESMQELLLHLLSGIKLPQDSNLLNTLRKIAVNNRSCSKGMIKCKGRVLQSIKSEDELTFDEIFVVAYLNDVIHFCNPVTMTADERIAATQSFGCCANNLLISDRLKQPGFSLAWKIFFNFLLDEDGSVREIACKLTHEMAIKSNITTTPHPNVDTFAVRQAVALLLVSTATTRPDDGLQVLNNLRNDVAHMRTQNHIQGEEQVSEISTALFDRSQLNTYYDAIMMESVCNEAYEILQSEKENIFENTDLILSKFGIQLCQ